MDILRRIMADYLGYEVFLSVNVTDIDDKIIARARKNKLLADYKAQHSQAQLADVKREVGQAVEAWDGKQQAKLAKLHLKHEWLEENLNDFGVC